VQNPLKLVESPNLAYAAVKHSSCQSQDGYRADSKIVKISGWLQFKSFFFEKL